ncbi:serine-type D-Ala-D-Ala carboxypeptidase [Candidatus Moduliflexus flocculans]|uniref:serine-type D-Ala-D-Ala carboxypeptidase n=1 Tax=Candidatus Moduliflexus flocculans TaxID=1499966 RepID=A0A0S6VT91_9BACT|nr:serine-type D-Ala-D-Ala carboxypeptidase [Candidatus Moduliflexus flocculans]
MQMQGKSFRRAVGGMLLVVFCLMRSGAMAAEDSGYKAAILLEAQTGQVLFEDNAHGKVIPASLVKMMVMLIVLEQIDAGRLSLTDMVTTSTWASKIGGSQVFLSEGEQFPLGELLKAIAMHSANDAATAVAEHVAGSTDAFVEMMNARAKELGLNDTTFVNVHGLPPAKGQKENYTSAYDMATLGRELLKHPKVLEWTGAVEDTFRDGKFVLTNTNRDLILKYPGVDGLKTGFHSGAGFNVCATVQRDDVRLIAVVMGSNDKADRYKGVVALFNKGFTQFEKVQVLRKGFTVGDPLIISKGKDRTATLVASNNVTLLIPKGKKDAIRQEVNIPIPRIPAPVAKGVRFGEVVIYLDDQEITRVDLVTDRDIERGNIFDQMKWWVVNKIS